MGHVIRVTIANDMLAWLPGFLVLFPSVSKQHAEQIQVRLEVW